MSSSFAHLHLHSEYSLLDGSCRVTQGKKNPLIDRALELGMDSVAITDHGAMYGTIEFVKAAKEKGIRPIIGCELYLARRTRFDKEPNIDVKPYHLLLLAKNNKGYSNLLDMVSKANLEGFYYKPRIDKELLAEKSEGIIALTACLQGEVPQYLLNGEDKKAMEALGFYQEIFGKDSVYVELMDHGIDEQKRVNPLLINLADSMNAPLVATNDVHYLNRADALAQEVQICIQTGKTLADQKRLDFHSDEFYLKSPDEMMSLFSYVPNAIHNTAEIASRCNVEIDFNAMHLPDFNVPDGYTLDSYLEHLCMEGFPRRYGEVTDDLLQRMKYELSVISEMGFPAYFLIVWDFINYARKNGIPVGPGRGSAAGSIVAYLIGITDIDPIRFGLLFERFLNPARKSMPDIDTDFCVARREEVIKYVTEKYGSDHVSQIATFCRMKAKNAIRDVGRVMGVPLAEVDKLSKMVPMGSTIEQALTAPAKGASIDDIKKFSKDLKNIYDSSKETKNLIDTAKFVEGLARQAGIHAAGVLISKAPLSTTVPLQRMKNGEVIAQYDMNCVSDIGLLKMDFLGLRNLTVIDNALKMIKKNHGTELDMLKIPLDDPEVYKLLSEAKTVGVFQFESQGMQKYLKQLKPTRFEDIVVMCALYRPGPLKGGVVASYIDRSHGKEQPDYMHPSIKPILEETYGVIAYQEQVMRIANVLSGYSMGQADDLRKAMGKKKADVMAKQKASFIQGAKNNNVDVKVAEKVWNFIEAFAGYGFNKSHSVAYGFVAYQTAYLKAHYTKEYMVALLTSVKDNLKDVSVLLRECTSLGIDVLPPDVNKSECDFSVEGNAVRFGMSAVKNVGSKVIDSIIEIRKKIGGFTSLEHFITETAGVTNKKVLEGLAKSGALSDFGYNRKTISTSLDTLCNYGACRLKEKKSGQISLFDSPMFEEDCPLFEIKQQNEFTKEEILEFEKEFLGMYITDHPLNRFKHEFESGRIPNTIEELALRENASQVIAGGLFISIKRIETKRKQKMAFAQLEDFSGSLEVVILPKVYESCEPFLMTDKPMIVRGKLELLDNDDSDDSDDEIVEKASKIKIIADSVYSMDSIQAVETLEESFKKERCFIKIDYDKKEKMPELKNLIEHFKGVVPLSLVLISPSGQTTLDMNNKIRVNFSKEFREQAEKLMGNGSIY